jgi:hypothetical protein
VRPFSLCDGAFDNNMVDLFVIVSSLPLGVKIGVGSSGDHEDCAVGGESVCLWWRLTGLWWRWIHF